MEDEPPTSLAAAAGATITLQVECVGLICPLPLSGDQSKHKLKFLETCATKEMFIFKNIYIYHSYITGH